MEPLKIQLIICECIHILILSVKKVTNAVQVVVVIFVVVVVAVVVVVLVLVLVLVLV